MSKSNSSDEFYEKNKEKEIKIDRKQHEKTQLIIDEIQKGVVGTLTRNQVLPAGAIVIVMTVAIKILFSLKDSPKSSELIKDRIGEFCDYLATHWGISFITANGPKDEMN